MPAPTPAHVFKVVVTGPFSAGKTTLVETVVQRDFVTMDADVSSSVESGTKNSTTVGMDFGVLTLEDPAGDIELRLYGTPGQERFDFMWEVLAQGSDVYVLVVDGASPATWSGARAHHAAVAEVGIPGVVAVNRCSPGVLERVTEEFADLGVPVVECDARDPVQVAELLVVALTAVLSRLEETAHGATDTRPHDVAAPQGVPAEGPALAGAPPREAVAASVTDDWSWL